MQHCSPGSNIFASRAENSVTPGSVQRMTEEVLRQKRRCPRISLPKGMRVAWHGGDLQLFSRVRTLGRGGLFISIPDPPPVGTKLKLAFEVPGGNVQAEAIRLLGFGGLCFGILDRLSPLSVLVSLA